MVECRLLEFLFCVFLAIYVLSFDGSFGDDEKVESSGKTLRKERSRVVSEIRNRRVKNGRE